ncbi:MAG TPA: hypothetical protein PL183_13485 [Aquamicrobium sp.]|nr:hypothetical protein [Aquamicrobium sp.]
MAMPYSFSPIHLTPDGTDALTLAEHGRAAGTTRAAMAEAIRQRRAAFPDHDQISLRAGLIRDGFSLGELLVWYADAMAEAEACAPHATGEAA